MSLRKEVADLLRAGHGQGSNAPHVELPWKDQKPPDAARTATNVAERKRRGKPFQKGNRAAANRVPTLALLGVRSDGVPELARKDLRRADSYRRRAVCELVSAYGYAGARACAVSSSAALVLASQRQVAALAFQTGDPALHKLAADLADKHAQLELKAEVLAQRAAGKQPPTDPHAAVFEAFGRKDTTK